MCEECPIRRACAERALTSGTSMDGGYKAPAVGVIQAGVYCDGSERATLELAAVAGVPAPTYRDTSRRTQTSDHCKACGRPMVRWHRGVTPEGYVMHRGRNFCTNCRAAYNAELKAEREALGDQPRPRKVIDRKNHSSPARTEREVAVQFTLFDRDLLET